MKKLLTLLMVGVLASGMVACGVKANETVDGSSQEEVAVEIELSLEEIIDALYEESGLELPKTMKQPLTDENMVYMLGVDNFDYLEGITSEPMMSSVAHSVVLFTVEQDADIETIKADIKANVDGRKWICVGVDEENIKVENVGNYVILIMDMESEKLTEAFYSVMQ